MVFIFIFVLARKAAFEFKKAADCTMAQSYISARTPCSLASIAPLHGQLNCLAPGARARAAFRKEGSATK